MHKLRSDLARWTLCFVALLSLSACDSSTFVDVPLIDCKNGKPFMAMLGTAIDPADFKAHSQKACSTRQKNYSGDFQCKGDTFQAKCS